MSFRDREEILDEAKQHITGDRNVQYGDPIADFRRTGIFWTEYLQGRMDAFAQTNPSEKFSVQPYDVAAMMMLLKISRLSHNPTKKDSWADGIGYGACGWDTVVEMDFDKNIVAEPIPHKTLVTRLETGEEGQLRVFTEGGSIYNFSANIKGLNHLLVSDFEFPLSIRESIDRWKESCRW